MKVSVYGSTLAAWVAATCLSKVGNEVTLHEGQSSQLKELVDIPVIRDEPNLCAQIDQQINKGALKRLGDNQMTQADVYWLALEPNDQWQVEQIIDVISATKITKTFIINQCNFEVGATEKLQVRLRENNGDALILYIPDNLEQGKAIKGFNQPERIILGVDTDEALLMVKALLRPFSQNVEYMQVMGSKEAEFTKFATTGMLAIRLGYINELANLADKFKVDIDVIKDGMVSDPRIGSHYLSPGCGFGGQNFHAYISMFSEIFANKGSRSLLKTVIAENEVQKELLFRKLWQVYNGNLRNKKVALWGGSFKPGTASIDHAPSLRIIDALLSQGVVVHVHDPEALANLRAQYAGNTLISYFDDMYATLEGCDALLLVTDWPQYLSPDCNRLHSALRRPLIIDGRNAFDKELLQAAGFTYFGVGR